MNYHTIIYSLLTFIILPINTYGVSDSTLMKSVQLEKQIMHAPTVGAKNLLLFQKAIVFKTNLQYARAIETLDRIIFDSLAVTDANQVHYEKAFNYYFLKSYALALQEMWNMTGFTSKEQTILYLMVLTENEKWAEFKTELIKAAPQTDTTALTTAIQTPTYQDPEYYRKLSRVPGLGLIKAGYTKKGITSILLQTAALGFGVFQYTQGFYVTGTFLGVLPARRFYNGGKSLAEASVIQNNNNKIEETKRKCYEYIATLH